MKPLIKSEILNREEEQDFFLESETIDVEGLYDFIELRVIANYIPVQNLGH